MQSCTLLYNPTPQISGHHFMSEDVESFQSSAKTAFDNKREQTFIKGNAWLLKKSWLSSIINIMMGSYCGMPSGQTCQDSRNNTRLHFHKRWRKTMNKGQARRDRITGVVGAKSIDLCSSAAYTVFFSSSIKLHTETQSEGWKWSFLSNI